MALDYPSFHPTRMEEVCQEDWLPPGAMSPFPATPLLFLFPLRFCISPDPLGLQLAL